MLRISLCATMWWLLPVYFYRVLNDRWALERAKSNVERYFSVVGILEELNSTLAVLERQLPYFFTGVKDLYYKKLLGMCKGCVFVLLPCTGHTVNTGFNILVKYWTQYGCSTGEVWNTPFHPREVGWGNISIYTASIFANYALVSSTKFSRYSKIIYIL